MVTTLKAIEAKVAQIVATFGSHINVSAAASEANPVPTSEDDLLNGPQLPAHAMDQSDIDKLLASFD